MATCPKCGKTVNEEIYVTLSEANKGFKDVYCSCGYRIRYGVGESERYEVKGYREQQIDWEKRKAELAEIETMMIVEPLDAGYKLFIKIFCMITIVISICTVIGSIFFRGAFWDFFILIGIFTTFGIWIGSIFTHAQAKYYDKYNKGYGKKWEALTEYDLSQMSREAKRFSVLVLRFLGFLFYMLPIVLCLVLTGNLLRWF